jgi:hypothetical protein
VRESPSFQRAIRCIAVATIVTDKMELSRNDLYVFTTFDRKSADAKQIGLAKIFEICREKRARAMLTCPDRWPSATCLRRRLE